MKIIWKLGIVQYKKPWHSCLSPLMWSNILEIGGSWIAKLDMGSGEYFILIIANGTLYCDSELTANLKIKFLYTCINIVLP